MESVEILVNITPSETRDALIETGILKEVHIERQANEALLQYLIASSHRVLPGMQSAFC